MRAPNASAVPLSGSTFAGRRGRNPARIAEPVREEMLALHRRSYRRVDRARFRADLAAKDWVLLLLDAAGRAGGFSTARLIRLEVDGRPRRFLFSGDTIVVGAHLLEPSPPYTLVQDVYVFVRSGDVWTQQATLSSGITTYMDEFGESLAIDGDTCPNRDADAPSAHARERRAGTC